MIKKHYLEELNIHSKYIRLNDKGIDVKRIQEWILLWTFINKDFKVSIVRDGEFGTGTLHAVKEFQKMKNLDADGIIGNITWRALTEPMLKAFSRIDRSTLDEFVIGYAQAHLDSCSREFVPNQGPWVRAYMNGKEGSDFPWCMGFVQTVLDQAYSSRGKAFTDYLPYTLACDDLGNYGLAKNKLIRNADLKKRLNEVQPGDVFLVCKKDNPLDWTHTGFVVALNGSEIETIEGNTNEAGSREGVMVRKRTRNLSKENIDVFSVGE
ncbi:MAG: peptidoglycan-binding domain-containing protein [Salinivirgaceae bacterium]